MIRRVPSLAVAAILFVACVPDASAPPVRTAPEPAPVDSTTTLVSGRTLEIIGCDDASADTEVVCQAYDFIHTRYVDPVDDRDLAEGAIRGLELLDGADSNSKLTCVAPSQDFIEVCNEAAEEADDTAEAVEAILAGMAGAALDPNSAYLNEDVLELIEEERHGEVEGIGALVSAEDRSTEPPTQCGVVSGTCRLYIVSVLAGAPAERAGLLVDDVVVGVDGESIDSWPIDVVTAAVRGPAGTDVALSVEREGGRIEMTITRAAVEIPVVESSVVGSSGYIRLSQFTENADEQLETAIFDLLTESIDTLVLDLRDNPGGLLTTAIAVTSQFLPDGDVVETRSPNDTETYEVEGNPIVPDDLEVVVVVNRGSASASELLSAVLQERGRAIVVGENTFGKNTVQQQFDLDNGGALKLTIARWVTPGGLDFGQIGVTPDVQAEFPSDMTNEAVVELALSLS